jgi:chromosome segregation ATPase
MKDKGLIFILLLIVAGLGIALIIINRQSAEQRKDAEEKITVASNNYTSARKEVAELQTVNQALETNLTALRTEFTNKMTAADANLRAVESNLAKVSADAKAQADSSALALAERDRKITELENQNQDLDKESARLRMAITNIQTRIDETQQKLARSEGDRDLLLKELKQLRAEKEEMEQKFNNIASLSEQLHKLRVEAAIARRLDWMRQGTYSTMDQKGGERLIRPMTGSNGGSSEADVELRQSGGVKIGTNSTSAPTK